MFAEKLAGSLSFDENSALLRISPVCGSTTSHAPVAWRDVSMSHRSAEHPGKVGPRPVLFQHSCQCHGFIIPHHVKGFHLLHLQRSSGGNGIFQ